jgi:hypothetical protein
LFLSLVNVLPAVPLTPSLFLSLIAVLVDEPLAESLFLSLVNVLPTAQLAESLDSFTRRRLACRAPHCIACSFYSSSSCPMHRSLHRMFLSLADALPAMPLTASLVSFARRRLACCTAGRIACFFHSSTFGRPVTCCIICFFPLSMFWPHRRSLHRLFLSLVDRHHHSKSV